MPNSTSAALIEQLKMTSSADQTPARYIGADLRGADLSGVRLAFVNLTNAQLDGANLTNARLTNVILNGAQLSGASLGGAELTFIEATQANFAEIEGNSSRWQHVYALQGQFVAANLNQAKFSNCTLESVSFEHSDLTDAAIVYSQCDHASFTDAQLAQLETLGTSFASAKFDHAKQFFASREILAEIIKPHIGRDVEQNKLVGAILLLRHWCFAEWKAYLSSEEGLPYYEQALSIFEQYPESSAFQALKEGWDWRP